VLAIFISPTNPKVITCISTVFNTIIDLIFLPSTITLVVIVLRDEVFSTYKYQ
jgi:hypothetical protein